MKKAGCIALILFVLLFSGCGDSVWDEPVLESGAMPDYSRGCIFSYDDEAQLMQKTATVICGTVTKKAYPDLVTGVGPNGEATDTEPCTIAYITVTESLKGALKTGDRISVLLLGNGITYIDGNLQESGGYFQVGDTLLLFLKQAEADPYKQHCAEQYARDKMIPYNLSSYQGVFWLGEDGALQHGRNTSGHGLFTDCATVEELKEKHGFA